MSRIAPEDEAPENELSTNTIIVIARPDAALRAQPSAVYSVADTDVDDLNQVLREASAVMRPLFGETEERLEARLTAMPFVADVPDVRALPVYYEVEATPDNLEALAARLAELPSIDGAYVAPTPRPATETGQADVATPPLMEEEHINDMTPADVEPGPATASFVSRQLYLNTSPAGIDARYAWTKAGGRGAGVQIIDCEGAWRFTHEDLRANQGGVIGRQTSDLGWRNHGTAVVGVIGGDTNNFGITGICSDAVVRGSSIFDQGGLPGAIRSAADRLRPGDIILLEVQYGHPTLGYTAVEWWPADFAAIRYAVARGIIVVEAAGNGNNNLDNPVYNTPLQGFPRDWRNPFNRANRDSGAILVGAGAPPPGTHGRNHGPDRSRLRFSNYGSAIDAQGWGREVTATGYGDLQGGRNEDLWYTDTFSGTSSASPIVVSALGCIQGILRARRQTLLTPQTARHLLRTTGSPQTDAPGRPRSQRIGNRPNLRQMFDRLIQSGVRTVPLYRYWNGRATDHFYTTNWRELGGGAHGWRYEGIQCYILPTRTPNSVPLYRYWNPRIADHFYTTNWNELRGGAYGWRYEGIQGYVMPRRYAGTVPLYRYWGNTDHFYTTNWNELRGGAYGWRYEGIQCYVYTRVTTPEAPGMEPAEEVSSRPIFDPSYDPLAEEFAPQSIETDMPPESFEANSSMEVVESDMHPIEFAEKVSTVGRQATALADEPQPSEGMELEPISGSFETTEVAADSGPSAFGPQSFQVNEEGAAAGMVVNININPRPS